MLLMLVPATSFWETHESERQLSSHIHLCNFKQHPKSKLNTHNRKKTLSGNLKMSVM